VTAGDRIAWFDASAGVSGDMALGALVGAGAPLDVLQAAVDAVNVEPVRLVVSQVRRAGLAATRVDVQAAPSDQHRSWPDVRSLLEAADLDDAVRRQALDVFARLARAEAEAHGTSADEVHFHEIGALDSIADVVGAAAGLHALDISAAAASAVTVGSGSVRTAHGLLPVPVPAVLALLRDAGAPVQSGPVEHEACTPTGAALLATVVTSWGPMPAMTVAASGTGAGGRDDERVPNVLRVVVGERTGSAVDVPPDAALVLEANVDDLDPRLWPGVLTALIAAGASDAWLTPILMKKGRPAHTLSVLTTADRAEAVRDVVFRESSTIGVRSHPVGKHALDRELRTVDVRGQAVRVKVARLAGEVVNASPEYDDVVAAAAALGAPVKSVLAEAVAAAHSGHAGHAG
jgi:pyridinium-3,5-bisthiocarboxylic acid mononucleotide nickel chelatase